MLKPRCGFTKPDRFLFNHHNLASKICFLTLLSGIDFSLTSIRSWNRAIRLITLLAKSRRTTILAGRSAGRFGWMMAIPIDAAAFRTPNWILAELEFCSHRRESRIPPKPSIVRPLSYPNESSLRAENLDEFKLKLDWLLISLSTTINGTHFI